jgi:hypothetical protein
MAGLKKSKRTKDTSSPNLVLVLFLIVFVLSTIILSLWLYFNYANVNDALIARTKADKEKDAAQKAAKLYQTAADDFRLALGQKLTADDLAVLKLERDQLLQDNSAYAKLGEKNLDAYKKLIESMRGDLHYDDNTGTYTKTYKEEAAKAIKERDEALGTLTKVQKQLKDSQDLFKTLDEKQNAYFDATTANLDKSRKELTKIANTQSDEMKKQIQKNDELRQGIVDEEGNRQKMEAKYKGQLREYEEALEKKDKDGAAGASRDTREPHALLLDISLGKPLWDDAVGSITRVDPRTKEVTLNIGSAKGVRPDLTFSVFAPSKYIATRAERQVKGTVEVVRVLGPNTSIARITATFDPEFPMHEGDLLFNLFWGTRVAVTGYVDVTGVPTDSPSEQMRQLNDFMYLLSRQGIIVDAYLDVTDGQVKGAITTNTRYLIRGEEIRIDPKELKENTPRAERAVAVNNGIIGMKKDAIERGMFVISAQNFATIIGYHRASTSGKEMSAFRPQLPTAGSAVPGLAGGVGGVGAPRVEAPAPMPMPMPEQKDKTDVKDKN